MSNQNQKIEKDTTRSVLLIERIVEKSKEIVFIKFILEALRKTKGLGSRIKYRPPNFSLIADIESSYNLRIQELEIEIANELKAEYTKDKLIIPDRFHLSMLDMESGFIIMEQITKKDKYGKILESRKVVLFLSENQADFLEYISPGEVHSYSDVQSRLNYCKTVLDKSKLKNVMLINMDFVFYKTIQQIEKEEFLKKYRTVNDD